jgi:hypothetical protein
MASVVLLGYLEERKNYDKKRNGLVGYGRAKK